jgi:hypothetical protein
MKIKERITMATIHVRDETYERLARRAADEQTTVDVLVEPVLNQLAGPVAAKDREQTSPNGDPLKAFEEWMAHVKTRADRYPPGFVVDDSRESIYAGRGE